MAESGMIAFAPEVLRSIDEMEGFSLKNSITSLSYSDESKKAIPVVI